MVNQVRARALALPWGSAILLALLTSCGGSSGSPGLTAAAIGAGTAAGVEAAAAKPNILFVIMDDVGVDQMASFGYGGDTPPSMPNMDAVARAGVRFRNTWSMPECSPGRAAMMSGRFPLRTNTYAALGPYDLANAQLSNNETTTPKLLRQANYESAMFGKFHLAGPDNNEDGFDTPIKLGWDYFYGWLQGGPASIDTTAGGVAPVGTYACGFVPGAAAGGADAGACYHPDNSCSTLSAVSAKGDSPGKQCLIQGGIFQPGAACQSQRPSGIDFTRTNAYYVSPLVIADANGVQTPPNSDPRSRGYRSSIETQAAIDWINSRSGKQPWMATVSYSAVHTPYQQAPGALLAGTPGDALNCGVFEDQRVISNDMTEAMDSEFGRLLVDTGLASRNADGSLSYDPKAHNTEIVIVGDNGSFANAVKEPFDLGRAKSTAYQTGVWVPMVVAGNLVASPNRDVGHMTNMVDVFRLFGEIAGIDVPASVPRTIDSAPLMPYLVKADQASIRTLNFTQGGYNVQANGQRNGACIVKTTIAGKTVASICTQSVFNKGPCEDNAGVWWGPGYTDASVISSASHPSSVGYRSCWEVNQSEYKAGVTLTPIEPEISMAVRDDDYKLVRNTVQVYDPVADTGGPVTSDEFYAVDQAVPTPKLDKAGQNLMPSKASWSAPMLNAYAKLESDLANILASQPACVGDGNIDGMVDGTDVSLWGRISREWGLSSMFDFNFDGKTDSTDLSLLQQNTGKCKPSSAMF